MAKPVLTIKQLSPEQRTRLDTIWKKNPEIEYEDLIKQLGDFTIAKPVFWSTRASIRSGIYSFAGVDGRKPHGARTQPPAAVSAKPLVANGNGHAVSEKPKLFNYFKLPPGAVEIVKRIDYEGYTEEDIKFIQQKVPSLLAQIFDTKATFKFYRVTEDDGNGSEIKQLELRRLS